MHSGRRAKAAVVFVIVAVVGIFSAQARDKRASTGSPSASKPTCERASYPGDPVCGSGNDDASLPTPTDRQGRRERQGGVAVTDDLRVKGRSDFNDNRYGGTQFYNPNLRPSPLQDVNGGGGVDFRF